MNKELLSRFLTSIILVPLLLWALYGLSGLYFLVFIALIIIIGAIEFSKMIDVKSWLVVLLMIIALVLILFLPLSYYYLFLSIVVIWWLINGYFIFSFPEKQKFWYKNKGLRIFNVLMVLMPTFISLIIIRNNLGFNWLLFLLFLIWSADIGAYFSGKAFGKLKLAPKVSPGKSIEGVLGGILLAILTTIMIDYLGFVKFDNLFSYIVLTILVVLISIIGDLFESLFKRVSGVKDSGNLLPGHGGILDRIDSLTAAAPLFLLGSLVIEYL